MDIKKCRKTGDLECSQLMAQVGVKGDPKLEASRARGSIATESD